VWWSLWSTSCQSCVVILRTSERVFEIVKCQSCSDIAPSFCRSDLVVIRSQRLKLPCLSTKRSG
jgi:hypothetical protein